MDRSLNYLSLARKAGLAELGEEPAGYAAKDMHAHLILVAKDASDHTWRRAKSYVAGTGQQCIRLESTKEEMGMAVGRQSLAIAAITDPALALALVKELPQTQSLQEVVQALQNKTDRLRQRQKEAKAHQRNRRNGMKKK